MNQWKSLSIKPGVFGTQGSKELCLGLCDLGVKVNRSFPCPLGGQKEPSLAESWVSALPCRRKDFFGALVRPQLLAPKALGQKLPCCPVVSGCASTIVCTPPQVLRNICPLRVSFSSPSTSHMFSSVFLSEVSQSLGKFVKDHAKEK